MGSIGHYTFRTALGTFLRVLVSVTALPGITQALRDIGSNHGQSIRVLGPLAGAHPAALLIPYLALTAASGFGHWGISRGLTIEPPSARVANLAGQTQ